MNKKGSTLHTLLSGFVQHIKKEQLFQRNDKLLIAVSGGVDSVVLCDLCHEAAYDFAIVHCNFQLRGAESDRDEAFVQGLALKYKVPVFLKRFETAAYATERKVSIQVAARELRYGWFRVLMSKEKPLNTSIVLLTAHHANDNIETLLMNFFKGTGINGLTGIAVKQDRLVRPLLFARKDELIKYATDKELEYVEDSSNSSNKYTRNYFRNELIPGVQKVFPMVEQNLQHNIERFREIGILYEESLKLHKSKLVKMVNNEVHLPVRKLLKTEAVATILFEILKPFEFSSGQVPDVLHLLKAETGKYVQSVSHRIIRNRDWLIVSPMDGAIAANVLIGETDEIIKYSDGILQLSTHYNKADFISAHEDTACIDKNKISFPLLLRKWKTGDYFYPLGMQKKKKLSKFFSDAKLSLSDKERIWVMESEQRIVWIVGLRIDDRFKVTDTTKEVLRIKIQD